MERNRGLSYRLTADFDSVLVELDVQIRKNGTAPPYMGGLVSTAPGGIEKLKVSGGKRWIAFVANERGCLDHSCNCVLVVALGNVTQDQCRSRIDAHGTDGVCRAVLPCSTDQHTIPLPVRESNVITADDFGRGGIVLQFVESAQRKTAIGIYFGFAIAITRQDCLDKDTPITRPVDAQKRWRAA